MADAPTTPETPCEENNTHLLTDGGKIQAFVQDSLDAHEEFLQRQSTQGHQPNSEHPDAEQPGQKLQREQSDKNDQDKSQVKQPVGEEKEGVNPEHPAQEQESVAGKKIAEDKKQNQSRQIQFMRNDAEREPAYMSEQFDKKQPSLVRVTPLEADKVVRAHVPGPLVTELEDAEQLETIHLPLHHSLCIDDLPDLEDVDTEDFTSMFSPQQVFKPKVEVASGGNGEDEPTGNQREGITTFSPGTNLLFFMSGCNKSTGVSNKSSSLVYPEDENACEPQLFQPVRKSKTNQTSSPPRCLIEELE